MRLDKFLSVTKTATRSESSKLIKAGKVTVNGNVAKKGDMQVDPERDKITFCGSDVIYKRFIYVMLNKPEGYVSATEDGREKTVLELLPEPLSRMELFPCGRLDKNTLGLMILTNDGEGAHRVLSPKHHVPKLYRFKTKFPLSDNDVKKLEGGTDIGGYITKPCKITLDTDGGVIELTEGKYHQIKRMAESVGNKITYLERISFGGVMLDKNLGRGEWRYLTPDEEEKIFGKRELSGKE